MKNLLSVLKIAVPAQIYLKDPETSDLGKIIMLKQDINKPDFGRS